MKVYKAVPPPPPALDTYSFCRVDETFLTDDFLDWLEIKGFEPRVWMNGILFYAHAGTEISVHSDHGGPNIWALNCVLEADGEIEMRWHAAKQGVQKTDDLLYTKYPASSPIINSTFLSNTICKIGIPHSSVNRGTGRWILSLRLAPSNIEWYSLLKKFS